MARTDSEIKTEIDQLEKLLSSGASSVSVDGVTTNFNSPGEINSRIKQLEQELQRRNGEVVTTIYKPVSLAGGQNL